MQMANDLLYWHQPFTTVTAGSFEHGDISWFPEGGLNAAYNCVDRHFIKNPDKVGVLIRGNPPAQSLGRHYL